jgi:predicted Zn-dependent protease
MKIMKQLPTILLFAGLIVSCGSIPIDSLLMGVAMNAESIVSAAEDISKASEVITPEEEYYIGRAVAANIITSYKPYTSNTNLTEYLNEICTSIALNSDKPDLFNGYHLMILDSEEVNAFASSGGHIFITKGLLRSATSEDAVAGIIAHEIAHIQLQHSVQAIKSSRTTAAWQSSTTTAASVAVHAATAEYVGDSAANLITENLNKLGSDINGALADLIENGYSRDQEFQADDLALEFLARTGYEPSTFVDMLKSLKASQAKSSGGFNSTHPSPDARITNAEKSIGMYRVPDTRSSRTARFQSFMTNI